MLFLLKHITFNIFLVHGYNVLLYPYVNYSICNFPLSAIYYIFFLPSFSFLLVCFVFEC